MKIIQSLLMINMMIMMLSIFIGLAFTEEASIDVIVIEKPKWCNSASISYYSILVGLEEEYKYSCVTYMSKNL